MKKSCVKALVATDVLVKTYGERDLEGLAMFRFLYLETLYQKE